MSNGLIIERHSHVDKSSLWNALTKHEHLAGVGHEVQDAFGFAAVRALAFEPLAIRALHPENWKKLDAGLDLTVRLAANGSLVIEVTPWKERCNPSSTQDRFDEFVTFRGTEGATCAVFEIQLDDLKSELRGAEIDGDEATVCKRRIVYLCYKHVLDCLARHFSLRVQTALLCLGDECRLMIRKMSSLENQVESVNPWPDDISWHSNYLALCSKVGVDPADLLEFFKTTLDKLVENQRLGILRQYLGKSEKSPRRRGMSWDADDPTRELMRALTVVASPQTYPPLTDHPSTRIEEFLLGVVREAQGNRVSAVAEHYCIDKSDARNLLRDHYPRVFREALTSATDIVPELEHHVVERAEMHEIISELQERFLDELRRAWDQSISGDLRGRKKELSKICGFTSFRALMQWVQHYAPGATTWLKSL